MEQEKKGIIGTIVGGFKESTRNVYEINKENLAAVKAYSKANFVEATTPSPEFVEFKEAKGLKGKAKAAIKGMKSSIKAASGKEKERRVEIQNHTAYKAILEEQREHMQTVIGKK